MNELAIVDGSEGDRLPVPTALSRMSEQWRLTGIERERLFEEFLQEPNRKAVEADYALRLGKSVKTLYRLYYAWKDRGIEGTVPKSAMKRTLADRFGREFDQYFQGLYERISTDSVPAARRLLLQELASGKRIPGIGTWRDLWAIQFPDVPPPRSDIDLSYPRDNIEDLLPEGLSPRNLCRRKGEFMPKLAARQGTFAASKYGPFVYTTRAGLKVGQILMFDDVWHNQNVNFMDSQKASRPLELCCLDVASAHKCAWGARPRLWNPETGKHEGIKDHEFRFLLAYVLCEECGYRPDGTILWVERGTASIDEDLAEVLHGISNKAITVKQAPLKDARQACSIYRAVGSGNPRFKARLEAHHSIGHTALAHVDGQVGRSADVCPEEVFGRDKANAMLLKLQAVLPAELAARLELPYMHWDEYMECVLIAYEALAWRTWHKLEGWEASKYYCAKFRIPQFGTDWIPLTAITDRSPEEAAAISLILEKHPEYCRIVPLSPIEVYNRQKTDLVKLPMSAAPMILGPRNGVIRACPESAEIEFNGRALGPAPHIYSREYLDADGIARRLQAGTSYLFHINLFSRSRQLLISDPDGRYLGTSRRIAVPCQADQDAVQERIKQTRSEWNRTMKQISARHLNKLAKEAQAVSNNTKVLKEAFDQGGEAEVAAVAAGGGECGQYAITMDELNEL